MAYRSDRFPYAPLKRTHADASEGFDTVAFVKERKGEPVPSQAAAAETDERAQARTAVYRENDNQ